MMSRLSATAQGSSRCRRRRRRRWVKHLSTTLDTEEKRMGSTRFVLSFHRVLRGGENRSTAVDTDERRMGSTGFCPPFPRVLCGGERGRDMAMKIRFTIHLLSAVALGVVLGAVPSPSPVADAPMKG